MCANCLVLSLGGNLCGLWLLGRYLRLWLSHDRLILRLAILTGENRRLRRRLAAVLAAHSAP
jgi:hypothetical protein